MPGAAPSLAPGSSAGTPDLSSPAWGLGPGLPASAQWVLALLAVDPVGLGGVVLCGGPGPRRDAWLSGLRALLRPDAPWLKLPHHANESALLGGLDLPATLQQGRPVVFTGLLARADGGVLLLSMAERTAALNAALLCAAMDRRQIDVQRDGQQQVWPCRWTLVALDEGQEDGECLPEALRDRLAFRLDTDAFSTDQDGPMPAPDPNWRRSLAQAQTRCGGVVVPDGLLQALAATASAWGVASMRALLLAVRAARAAAALEGCEDVQARHAELAAALVLAPRATRMPDGPPAQPTDEDGTDPSPAVQAPPAELPPDGAQQEADTQQQGRPDEPDKEAPTQALEDRLADAVRVGLPADLLAQLQAGTLSTRRARGNGRFGASQDNGARGRVIGSRPGRGGTGARLHLIDTLRAAAPWQRMRRTASAADGAWGAQDRWPANLSTDTQGHRLRERPVLVRTEDLRMTRRRQHRPGTTVFLVDASGSSALHRMAEAKGAVELLLAECYVRRDQVAVLAFRGTGAQVLLPPTRSLVRAKRQLAALPGGGGTPLACGIEAARALCQQIGRRGEAPTLVLLTDGRANIAADGGPGRERATADAHAAAARLQEQGLSTLLIDTSPQPGEAARELARRMGARYLALPHAGASGLCQAVQQALPKRTA